MRWLRAGAVAFILGFAADARAESLEVQVNRAIERGLAVARTYLDGNGGGRTQYHESYPEGDTALVLYTLVKSGVSADDPLVQKSLDRVRSRPVTKTYGASVVILALDAFKDHTFDPEIQAAAKWLEEGIDKDARRWGYPGDDTDLSNTQYAVLGLWTAERHGYTARPDTWAALLAGVAALTKSDEGLAYRPDRDSTGSMTVAGITVLELALARSPDGELPARFAEIRRKAKAALAKGWSYLERRFSVLGNPLGPHGFQEDWHHYFLFGVERLCAIADRDRIAGHDWYAEGARHLVATQHDDGSWGDAASTCFALLFLRRATATTMDRDLKRLQGDGVAARPARPKPPRDDVPFVRRWLLMGPLDDPDDEMLEKSFFDEPRAVPRALSYSGSYQWMATRSLRNDVDLGGPDGPRDHTITCAFVWIHTQSDLDAVLWIGHDDGARVWFDSKLVHDRHFTGRQGPDRYPIPVRLEAGPHRLLMKVQNYGGLHTLWLRIAHADGTPAPEIATSLSPEDLELGDAAVANPSGLTLDDVLLLLPRDRRQHLTFDDPEQLGSIAFDGCYGPYPLWSADPAKRPTHVPNPGATGAVAFHPVGGDRPARAYWRLKLPDKPSHLRLRVSATTASAIGRADVHLRIGVFDGTLHWIANETVGPDAAPAAANWRWIDADLASHAGSDVLVVLEAADGGKRNWDWEGLWIDDMEIR